MISEILLQSDLFSHLGEEELSILGRWVYRSRYPAGAHIIKEGTSRREVFFLHRGRVRIERNTAYGAYRLAQHGPGILFGEVSFLDHLPRGCDVFFDRESEVLTFDPLALDPLLDKDQRVSMALLWTLWKSLSSKLRVTNESLTHFFANASIPPPQRSAEQLMVMEEFRVGLAAKRQLFEEQRLSTMEITVLSTLSDELKLAEGDILFQDGDPGDSMFLVLDGRIMISKYIPGAGEEALAFMERGDYFGEMALIDNLPRSATAKAHAGGAVVLSIPRNVLGKILDMNRVSSLPMLRILCQLAAKRLRELDDKIVGWFMLAGGFDGPIDLSPDT